MVQRIMLLKDKPPLTFNKHNCNMFILYLHKILSEDFLNKNIMNKYFILITILF